ncbi:MAG TPA: MHYT domain-containing protein, partial [Roseomonas sp.]
MIRILACLVEQHDPLAVFAAIVICAAAAMSCALLLRGQGWVRLVLAAVVIGAGAWATHFVALLAYDPGLPMSFALEPTLLSAVVVLAASLAGLALWFSGMSQLWRRAAGGAVLGLGIGGMHYLGM